MSRRTIVRRAQRRTVFVPLWLKRLHMAEILKALDLSQVRPSGARHLYRTYSPRAPYALDVRESDDV